MGHTGKGAAGPGAGTEGDAADVRSALESFQDGYTRRDVTALDRFMELFVTDDAPELVGTEAVEPGDLDWGVDHSGVRAVIEWDWRFWWDVRLDVQAARIHVHDDVAWLSAPGKLEQCERARAGTRAFVEQTLTSELHETLDDRRRAPEDRLAELAVRSLARVRDYHLPEGTGRPFTFTAVLVRDAGGWRFQTIHFSVAAE